MRDKKLMAVCILALVVFSAFVQGLPEASQHGGGDDMPGGSPRFLH